MRTGQFSRSAAASSLYTAGLWLGLLATLGLNPALAGGPVSSDYAGYDEYAGKGASDQGLKGCEQRAEPCRCAAHMPALAPEGPQAAPQAAAGAFVAPPQSGAVQGASRSTGIRGLEIEFPALRLQMPSITLPSMFSSRSNARMVLDSASAPYVTGGVGYMAGGQAAVMAAPAAPMAAMAAPMTAGGDCSGSGAPSGQLAQLQQLQAALQQLQEQAHTQMTADADAARMAEQAAEARLRELEETERRLEEKIRRLQECLQELLSVQEARLSVESRKDHPPAPRGFAGPSVMQHTGAAQMRDMRRLPQVIQTQYEEPVDWDERQGPVRRVAEPVGSAFGSR